jgi:enoyl-CoA hydratase/carnithine racemase
MSMVSVEDLGPVAILRLNNGVTNAIGPQLVEEMGAALAAVRTRYKGLVLAGNAKFFSIGLNLPELLALDPGGMTDFWTRFEDLVIALYTLPIPTASALCGHAPAGGTILALTCDFRLAAAGRKLMGLNEIQIGLPVPFITDRMLRQIAGDAAARRIEYGGELVGPEDARALGLVDEVLPEAEVESRAVEKITALAALPAQAFSLIKQHRVRDLPLQFQAIRRELGQSFMNCWFAPAVQELLGEAAKKY